MRTFWHKIYIYRNHLSPRIWMCNSDGAMRSTVQSPTRTGHESWQAAMDHAQEFIREWFQAEREFAEGLAHRENRDRNLHPWLYDEED